MNKEQFLKELRYQLRYLNNNIIEEELNNYTNLDNYDLKPEQIANSIYQKRGLNIKVTKKIKIFDSISIIINVFKSKDKNNILNIILFFIYIFILIILIKIPFIYIRDLISTMFNNIINNDLIYNLWNLLFEILYAITAIIIMIQLIKNKAQEIENTEK